MPVLSIHLFGVPRIERDGVAVAVERRKSLALLAYLAVMREPHGREALATLLSPMRMPDAPLPGCAARWSISTLALGKGWLDADGDQIALRADVGVQVDVNGFIPSSHRLPSTAIHLSGCVTFASPTWPKLLASIQPTFSPASPSKMPLTSTTGRAFRPRACAWSWPACWRGWRKAWRAASSGRRPSAMPGVGWRWTR